jgi:predicted lipoprotein with Yx(FWY)xxD motif
VALSALVLAAALLSGCGGSGSTSTVSAGDMNPSRQEAAGGARVREAVAEPGASGTGADTASATTVAAVKVMPTPGLGLVLVDSEGMTLYDSHGDNPMLYQFNRPPTPSCYEACAEVWLPVLTAASPEAIGRAKESLLGTIRREDGSRQVTYDRHPLYAYTNDKKPGETNGDYAVSFGEEWHALEADGEEPMGEGREGH